MRASDTGENVGWAQGLRRGVDEAEQLLKSAANDGDRRLGAMKARLEHQLKRMRLELDALEDQAAHRVRRATRIADRAVQAHPYRSMVVAAAIGLLAGAWAARR